MNINQNKKNMADNNSTTSGGIGFGGLLCITFIVLKLTHTIDWSWWWVLSPMWIPLSLVILGFGIYLLYLVFYKWPNEKKRLASGMNEWAWKNRKKNKSVDGPTIIGPPKSKWQQRMEEMKKKKP